ncbi:MAG: M60 family metallopeptidase [Alloprevotella sp.]|nr:M60 family metallopeptidase [Alloprevotella sp.]
MKNVYTVHSLVSVRHMAMAAGMSLALLLGGAPAEAQSALPEDAHPMIVTPHRQSINYRERTLCYPVTANVPYEVHTTADWATPRRGSDGTLYVHVACNYGGQDRLAVLTFQNEEKGIMQQMEIAQGANQSILEMSGEVPVTSATDNNHASSGNDGGISNSLDGNTSTLYHSNYGGGVSATNPVLLTYNFNNAHIDYINYVPRSSGTNGNFKEVEVYVKKKGESKYTLYNKYDWEGSGEIRTIAFPNGGMDNVASIQFKVLSGQGGYASCAEMEFRVNMPDVTTYGGLFTDDVCSQLREGVTEADLDSIRMPFVKALAMQLASGKYDLKYRVATFPCHLSPVEQSERWSSPGKYYDQMAGVTGINVSKGTHAVIVSGIPEGMSVSLKVVAWYAGPLNDEGVGTGPATYTYPLKNGLNTFNYKSDYDGLAYISYYCFDDPKLHPDIKAHFVNGEVQGYLSLDKTNDEMYDLCMNAPNACMDVVGSKVHSVWTSQGLAKYCKTTKGEAKGYIQYMHVLDSLVAWEHRLLGMEKYNRIPDNRTMAYVNYTYYMFQGGYGVSFMYNTESRVLNCKTIVLNDDDAIWGLSHEWGHQHQMTPYFCWAGQSEATNNMNSCYNVLHMGYTGSHGARIQNNWTAVYNHFFQGTAVSSAAGVRTSLKDQYDPNGGSTAVSAPRLNAYKAINQFAWCPEFQDSIRAQYARFYNAETQEWIVPSYFDDPDHGLSINEVYCEEFTAPFFMLYCYFSNKNNEGYTPDYQEDMYESLRQNDEDNGSAVEPDWNAGVKSAKTTVDKYELLASAQNGNKNGAYERFIAAYPNSCWTKKGYIVAGATYQKNSVPFAFNYIRKASKLTGYNLFPYFEKFGFFRTVFMEINDYGNKYVAQTKDMVEEFRADMEALGLKTCTDEMIETIAHSSIPRYSVPNFPNTPIVKE